MKPKDLLNTKEVAGLLGINEKAVYGLISDKGLPASKVTGKWLFPRKLVEAWVKNSTINYPEKPISQNPGLLVIAGSNDILLEKAVSRFNRDQDAYLAVFGNTGSMGGILALKNNRCHIAASHILESGEEEYNFGIAGQTLRWMPAIVDFCRREQGIIVSRNKRGDVSGVADLASRKLSVINRPEGTGTRLLFDRELQKAGLTKADISGYGNEAASHMEVGLAVLSGHADAGIGIRAVADLLGLDFIPLRWERFDFLIPKARFFEQGIQLFLSFLHEEEFAGLAAGLAGYDITHCGRMRYPGTEPINRTAS